MSSWKVSRRSFLRDAGILIGGAAITQMLPACAPAAAPTEPPSAEQPVEEEQAVVEVPPAEQVELRLTVWGDVTDKMWNENMVSDFMETQNTIVVTGEQYPGGYYDKIQANFAAGVPADIVYFQGWSWQPFADNGVLAPLDEFIEADGVREELWPDIPNYHNNTKRDGKTYMTVIDTGSCVMFYVKELFDKAQIPYPTDDWTYEDFQNAVEATSFEEGDVKYFGYSQANGWNGAYARCLHWIRKDGLLEWDRIEEPQEARLLQDGIIDALQYTIVDTIANGWCPTPDAIQGGGISIATARVAMTCEGPWTLANMYGPEAAREGGIPFDVVGMPLGTAKQDKTLAEVHGLTLSQAGLHKEAAWEYCKFSMTEQAQARVAEGGRQCSTPEFTERLWAPIAQELYHFENGKAFANAMRTGDSPIIAGAGANLDAISEVSGTPLTEAWEKMCFGVSAEEALTEAQPLCQKILDDYWAEKA